MLVTKLFESLLFDITVGILQCITLCHVDSSYDFSIQEQEGD